jgi:hypothetical protein
MHARRPAVFGVDPSAQGGSPPNPSDVTNPGLSDGASYSALGSGIGSADASMLVSLGSVLITLAAPGFRGSDKAANLLPIALTIFRERERRRGFGRVTGSSLASRLSTVPAGSVRSSWDGLGTGAPPGLPLRQPRGVNRL